MSHDPKKCIEKPLAALVQRPDGEERVRMLPPMVAIADDVWNEAIDEAVDSLASFLVRRGSHDQPFEDVKANVVAHLDKSVMAAWLAKEMLHRLAAMIGEELEIDLDLQVDQVETTASGSISAIDLPTSLGDAATIFNCNAAVSLTGELEALRNQTAALQPAEWGLLLYRLIGFLDAVRTKEEDIYLSIFRELQKKDLIREAMVRSLDQWGLTNVVFGQFPPSTNEGSHSLH